MDNFGIPFIDTFVEDGKNLIRDARKLVCEIKRGWREENIVCDRLNDGFTNSIVTCSHPSVDITEKGNGDQNEILLVRVYGRGTDAIVNRAQEKLAMIVLHENKCASQLVASFKNGIIYSFVPGETMNQKTLYDFNVQRLLAKQLVRFHSTEIEKAQDKYGCKGLFHNQPQLFSKLKSWISGLSEQLNFSRINWTRDKLLDEVELVEKELISCGSPIVFCHNDLLPNNIVYDKSEEKVSFIDFEYTHPNYQAYDIATFFCEFAGMKETDFSLYPSKEYQMKWLQIFTEYYFEQNGKSKIEVSDEDVVNLYVQVNKFALVSHLHWGVWALVQSNMSTIDYDYLEYGQLRLEEYERRKKEGFLGHSPID